MQEAELGVRARHALRMRELVDAHGRSGVSRAAFCRDRGVPPTTFDRWRRRFRGAASRFVEVEVVDEAAPAGAVEMTLPGGATIRIGEGASERLIRRLLRAATPC